MGEKSARLDFKLRHPPWLKVRLPEGKGYLEVKGLIDRLGLNTVCQSASCPNVGDCWTRRTATFMILGDICTRSCGFCNIKTGRPGRVDEGEPLKVAMAVGQLGLRHAVITSVDRDDLPDGGAAIWRETILNVKDLNPRCAIEVLIPDLKGDKDNLSLIFSARPTILAHNVETVPRLHRLVRPQAKYARSLEVLRLAAEQGLRVKSGLMVGLGEELNEVLSVMADLRSTGCSILTIGQYLSPSRDHLPVIRYWTPEEFATLKEAGNSMGYAHVESAPLVRSSYHADEQAGRASMPGPMNLSGRDR